MKLAGFFALFALAVCVSANCGCLNCNKNLHVISHPADRVKVIYKNTPCSCPTSIPYSLQIPVLQREYSPDSYDCYDYQIQSEKVVSKPQCPISRRYDSRVLVPLREKSASRLDGLSASLDRIVLADAPEPQLHPGCPQPLIETLGIPRPGQISSGQQLQIPLGQQIPSSEQYQIQLAQQGVYGNNAGYAYGYYGYGPRQGKICGCFRQVNPVPQTPDSNLCETCAMRLQNSHLKNLENNSPKNLQRVVSSKPSFARIYRRVSCAPEAGCHCQNPAPRILKIKPYFQVFLRPNPGSSLVVHRYDISNHGSAKNNLGKTQQSDIFLKKLDQAPQRPKNCINSFSEIIADSSNDLHFRNFDSSSEHIPQASFEGSVEAFKGSSTGLNAPQPNPEDISNPEGFGKAATQNLLRDQPKTHPVASKRSGVQITESKTNLLLLGDDSSPNALFQSAIFSFMSNTDPFDSENQSESDRSKRSINYQLLASKTNPPTPPRKSAFHLKRLASKPGPAILPSTWSQPKLNPRKIQFGKFANPFHKPLVAKKPIQLPKFKKPNLKNNVMLQSPLQKAGQFMRELILDDNPLTSATVQMPNYEEQQQQQPLQPWWHEDEEDDVKPQRRFKLNRLGRLRRAIRVEDESMLPFFTDADEEKDSYRKPSVVSRRGRKEQDEKPTDSFFDNVLDPASIIHLMNTPMRYLNHFHNLKSNIGPVVGTFPKAMTMSKRYIADFLKHFGKHAIRIGAHVITDFDRMKKSKVLPKRRHRRSISPESHDYGTLMDLLKSLVGQSAPKTGSAEKRAERRKREVEDPDHFEGPVDGSLPDRENPKRNYEQFEQPDGQNPKDIHNTKRDDKARRDSIETFRRDLLKPEDHAHDSFFEQLDGQSELTPNGKLFEDLKRTISDLEQALLYSEGEYPDHQDQTNPDLYLSGQGESANLKDFLETKVPTEHDSFEGSGKDLQKAEDFLKMFLSSGQDIKRFLRRTDFPPGEVATDNQDEQPKHFQEKPPHEDTIDQTEPFVERRRKREVDDSDKNSNNKDKELASKTDGKTIKNKSPDTHQQKHSKDLQSKTTEAAETPANPSEFDIEVQAIKARAEQLSINVQKLTDLDLADDYAMYGIYSNLLKLEALNTNLLQLWKSIVANYSKGSLKGNLQLLDKLKEAEELKEGTLEKICLELSNGKSLFRKKLIRLLIRLQKFHCAIKNLRQKLNGEHLDWVSKDNVDVEFLQRLHFVEGGPNIFAHLKRDRDGELQRQQWLLDNLRKVLTSGHGELVKEEAKILWEINNVEKLQQQSILELNQKILLGQRIRRELKILFDLQKQMEHCEDKQKALIRSFGGAIGSEEKNSKKLI